MRFPTLLVSSLLLTTACAGLDKGDEEAPLSDSGKDDSFRSPTEHGELSFKERNHAVLDDDTQFHSWTFELTAKADITLQTIIDEVNQEPDTVMYLYRRDDSSQSWGRHIAKNDDQGTRFASRIDLRAERGQYRVKVKGFSLDEQGPFEVDAACDGDGCPAPRNDTLEALLAIGEFSAADFDCGTEVDDDAMEAFDVEPDYVFFHERRGFVRADFGFRQKTTDFETIAVAIDDGVAFQSESIEADSEEELVLTIFGRTRALADDELIESDQPPIAIMLTYEYEREGTVVGTCEVELISGLRF